MKRPRSRTAQLKTERLNATITKTIKARLRRIAAHWEVSEAEALALAISASWRVVCLSSENREESKEEEGENTRP